MGLFRRKKKDKIQELPMPPKPDFGVASELTKPTSLERQFETAKTEQQEKTQVGQETQGFYGIKPNYATQIEQPKEQISVTKKEDNIKDVDIQQPKQQPKTLQSIEEEMGLTQPIRKDVEEHKEPIQTAEERFKKELVGKQLIKPKKEEPLKEEKENLKEEKEIGLHEISSELGPKLSQESRQGLHMSDISPIQTKEHSAIPKPLEHAKQDMNIMLPDTGPEIESSVLGVESVTPNKNYLFLKYGVFINFVEELKQVKSYISQLSGNVGSILANIDAQALKLKRIQKITNIANDKLLRIDSKIFGISKSQK